MSAPVGGEVLFDAPLEVPAPLFQMWDEAVPYKKGKRFHRAAGLLLRKHLKCDYSAEKVPVPMATRLSLVEAHLAKLQQFGLCVISHVTEVAPEPEDSSLRKTNAHSVVAHSASKFVEDAVRLDEHAASHEIPKHKVQEMIVDPLRHYYEWCRQTGVTVMLSDIFDPHQFSWQQSSGVVFLHDIDPHITEWPPGTAPNHPEPLLELYEFNESCANIGL